MCESCIAETIYIGEIFTGWHLEKATKTSDHIKAGDYCLVECNGPTFTFHTSPIKDDLFGLSDEEENKIPEDIFDAQFENILENRKNIAKEIVESIQTLGDVDDVFDESQQILNCVGRLYLSATKSGYNFEVHGDIIFWLCDRIVETIEKYKEPL